MKTMIPDAGSMFAGMTDAHIAHAVRRAEAHYRSIGRDPLACDVALTVLRDCDAPEAGNPVSVSATPSSLWSEAGKPDPHGKQYDCERAALALGNLTDDELANAVYLKGDRNLSYSEMVAGELPASAYLLAAKDRIRWLSRALVAALAARQPGGEVVALENFPCYLIDKCEGDVISEEGIQQALADMLKDSRYAAPPAHKPAQVDLGQFRALVEAGNLLNDRIEEYSCADGLMQAAQMHEWDEFRESLDAAEQHLALIDSQGNGNG